MGSEEVETTHNINKAFGPGTAGSRSFEKETRALKHSSHPSEVTNKLKTIIKVDPLTTT